MQPTHYLLRVGDGINFMNSSNKGIWAVKSWNKSFLKNVKEGDILWFIRSKKPEDISTGRIIAVATFHTKNERIFGPLISTATNDELGWDEKGVNCDIEIHYTNLYNLLSCQLFTGQRGQQVITNYHKIKDDLLVNLIVEYEYICKYANITKHFQSHSL